MPNAIDVQDVSFGWSSQALLLNHCYLQIPAGEFWMLLGRNGSGKSTLMKLLAGLLLPQTGYVHIHQPVGFVFQNPDQQLVMPTVGADIAFSLTNQGLTSAEVRLRVQDALATVNLSGLARRPIYALSGGQKQRVAIAGAIARHCEVLLLDEPTALLDPDSQQELLANVRELVKQRGMTALWVTHRLEELVAADGAVVMERGQVIEQGPPSQLKHLRDYKLSQACC
ncbi:energy-coupling factor ABC transporter ATP-binding protein [Synechococcus sp. PCC 6312]|uniref:energy-coupling factor ABC transporter ATP-binding protein n=1 Tax=Synechococcus sp. (strain ATCC 27167 / PCC 6312) TaxID=195253 RepID=UPI00029F33B5|nr:ATP-binding cassette domain-containing protein [Synechococcus sp. PCC 6312]AFY60475.1 ABC-type cobalt transport system, ATPase component [Synechococcus sp. PCC 6312]